MTAYFDLSITVSGEVAYSNLSDVTITRAAGGLGTSGVLKTCLTFTIPRKDCVKGELIGTPQALMTCLVRPTVNDAWVEVKTPAFYVDTKTYSRDTVTYTCYDALCLADNYTYECELHQSGSTAEVEVFDGYIKIKNENVAQKSMDYLSVNGVIDAICRTMSIMPGATFNIYTENIPTTSVYGQTLSSILSTIASLNCGVFCINNDGMLDFVRYSEPRKIVASSDYSAPCDMGSVTVGAAVISYNGNEYMIGEPDKYFSLSVSVPNCSNFKTLYSNISGMCGMIQIEMGAVDTAVVYAVPEINDYMTLEFPPEDEMDAKTVIINSITVKFMDKMYASLARNCSVSMVARTGFTHRVNREISNTRRYGTLNGNCIDTKYQGRIYTQAADTKIEVEGDN